MALDDFTAAGIFGIIGLILHIIICIAFNGSTTFPIAKVVVLSEGITELIIAIGLIIYVKLKN